MAPSSLLITQQPVLQVKFNEHNLVTSSKDDTIIVWDIIKVSVVWAD
jgi:hypothetical protein